MAHLPFNANDVQGDVQDYTPITPGKYPAVITETSLGEIKGEKHTQQLCVIWTIQGGAFDQRTVRNYITVKCDSSDAQNIGLRTLKNICESVGLASINDTDELLGRKHVIDITHQTRKNDPDFNAKKYAEVRRCYPAGENYEASAGANVAPVAQAATPPPVNNPAPPWGKPTATIP